jgi:rhodanese-related sulfurtransferase
VKANIMEPQRISTKDVKRRLDAGERTVFLDTRSEEAWKDAEWQIPGSKRIPPDGVADHLGEIPNEGLVVTYCTSPQEQSSARAAQTLLEHGWKEPRMLAGGFDAWRKAGLPVERKARRAETLHEVQENLHLAEGDQDLPA